MAKKPKDAAPAAEQQEVPVTDTTTTNDTAVKAKKGEKVADHYILAADSTVVKEIGKGAGIRYVPVGVQVPDAFDYVFEVPKAAAAKGVTIDDLVGTDLMMLAIFGAKTKATNEASRSRQAGEATDEQLSAIMDVFGNIRDGVWREKAEGGTGARIDRATVAKVLLELLEREKLPVKGTVDTYTERLTTEDDYFKKVWSNDAIKSAYRAEKGVKGAALSDLA